MPPQDSQDPPGNVKVVIIEDVFMVVGQVRGAVDHCGHADVHEQLDIPRGRSDTHKTISITSALRKGSFFFKSTIVNSYELILYHLWLRHYAKSNLRSR